MEHKAEQTERRNNEMKLSEERKHAEEVAFLKKTNAQLKVIVSTKVTNCFVLKLTMVSFFYSLN